MNLSSATETDGDAEEYLIPTPTSGEVSLYFHVPFCTKKCDYCHFFVLPNLQSSHDDFVTTLLFEWKRKKDLLKNRTIKSIYFGGGTPALLAPRHFEMILNSILFDPSIEITLEANPENINLELLKGFRKAGINRLSIGAQSFDDELLKVLTRTHDSLATLRALEDAKTAGFDNISIDLMYDIPAQTEDIWVETLKIALEQPITHLSLYNLTIEPETAFFKRRKTLEKTIPSPDSSLFMFETAVEYLSLKGLLPYEISAFALPNFYSRHNTGYWTGREFLGLGPSAYSYFDNNRFRNIPHFGKYKKSLLNGVDPSEDYDHLNASERRRELLAVEIRLKRGVNLTEFEERHGALEEETLKTLKQIEDQELITVNKTVIKLSHKGVLFYDSIASEII